MSDSDGSLFEEFTEAEVRHMPSTQAVNSVNITRCSLSCSGIAGSSARQASVVSTLGHSRHSRSRSRAPGLLDQIREILHVELRRGSDRRHRSSSSSGGSSDSRSSPQTEAGSPTMGTVARFALDARPVGPVADMLAALTPSAGVTALVLPLVSCALPRSSSVSWPAASRAWRLPLMWKRKFRRAVKRSLMRPVGPLGP